jgi:TolB protein
MRPLTPASIPSRVLTIVAATLLSAAELSTAAAQPQPLKQPQRLMIMNEDGSDQRVLLDLKDYPSVGSPAFSPDGQRIAFDGWRAGESSSSSHIFLMNVDGTGIQDLGDGLMPTWSPDGRRLAMSRSNEYGVWLMEIASGELTRIDERGWGIQWSPDGRSLAFSRGSEFVVHDVASGAQREMLGEARVLISSVLWNSAWSPDSKRIACTIRMTTGQTGAAILNVAGPQPDKGPLSHVKILATGTIFPDFAWHPKQPRLLTGMLRTQTKRMSLYEFNPNVDGPPELVIGPDESRVNSSGCFSPDGKQFLYVQKD